MTPPTPLLLEGPCATWLCLSFKKKKKAWKKNNNYRTLWRGKGGGKGRQKRKPRRNRRVGGKPGQLLQEEENNCEMADTVGKTGEVRMERGPGGLELSWERTS